MRSVLVPLTLVALAACDKPVDELSYSEKVTLVQELEASCVAQGFPQNSPLFQSCFKHEADREIRRRQNIQNAWINASQNIQSQQTASSPPMMCSGRVLPGGNVTTTCR